jgi:uncharacterized membrane protein YedE/YeeE
MRQAVLTLLVGAVMGFILSRIGFSSWDEVHKMFTFADLRMFIAFALGVALLAGATWLLRKGNAPRVRAVLRPIHRGTVIGGVLFGAGWALSGACPSIALVQLGEGQLAAVFTLAGIFAGNWLYAFARERYLHWDTGSCVDE